jgi:hypothetical protein
MNVVQWPWVGEVRLLLWVNILCDLCSGTTWHAFVCQCFSCSLLILQLVNVLLYKDCHS